jgi:Anti-sigma-K factor rskA.
MNENTEEMRLDLLIKRAVYGLTDAEQRQLDNLDATPDNSFEMAAAAIHLTGVDQADALPEALRSKILASAYEIFDDEQSSDKNENADRLDYPPVPSLVPQRSFWDWFGWAVAAAACILLAVNIYTTRLKPAEVAQVPQPTPSPEQRLLGPEQMRDQLIAAAPDLLRVAVGAGTVKDIKPAGDIVWSDAKQAGYVRLTGLPKNDPGKQTYQLWIVAENQDPKTPVDGGTFDINSDGEIIIPIDPKVKVSNPKAFAITVEKPGGVVVSKQEKVAALAKT